MKLHSRNMPGELRLFGKDLWDLSIYILNLSFIGDLYVKQEFRLHLDKASDD